MHSPDWSSEIPNDPVYISYLDGAAAYLLEALTAFEQQNGVGTDARNSLRLATCIRATYLAVDRLLKCAVARVDPALLIRGLNAKVLQLIRQVPVSERGPSIFTTGVHFETYDADALVGIVRDVVNPQLVSPPSAAVLSELEELLRWITRWRNQLEHAELYGHSDEFLARVERQLGLMLDLITVLAPEVLDRIRELGQSSGVATKGYSRPCR